MITLLHFSINSKDGYISQKYTWDKYTLEKYSLEKYALGPNFFGGGGEQTNGLTYMLETPACLKMKR